jgi:hypothetical protein
MLRISRLAVAIILLLGICEQRFAEHRTQLLAGLSWKTQRLRCLRSDMRHVSGKGSATIDASRTLLK